MKSSKQQKAIIEGQAIPGYQPPDSAHEVTVVETEGGIELHYYSTFDKAMNGMLDEQ